MAQPPSMEDLGPLLAETNSLDAPVGADQDGEEDGEFMSAARAAVGSDLKATALNDAIAAYCRREGITGTKGDDTGGDDEGEGDNSDVGAGFDDL